MELKPILLVFAMGAFLAISLLWRPQCSVIPAPLHKRREPTPAQPVPSTAETAQPVPTPAQPVCVCPTPAQPVPCPTPAQPVPTPAQPVPTPAQPVPTPAAERPSKVWYNHMKYGIESERMAQLYYSMSDTVWMMGYVTWRCPPGLVLTRLGPTFEGGKTACLPPQSERAQFAGKCLIYSFGSNGQFEFEEAMWQRFGCEIHTFDCTIDPHNKPSYVVYHKWCLGVPAADPKNATSMSFWQLVQVLGHENREPLLVKMDIEGWEWTFFTQYFAPDNKIPRFSQFLLEMHDLRTTSGGPMSEKYKKSNVIAPEVPEGGGAHVKSVLNALIDLDEEFDMVAKEHNAYATGVQACLSCSEFTFLRRNYNWTAYGLSKP